jgi:hypothetical protein
VALWREALLAQKVLAGGTRGYRQHPQLHRFRECDDPCGAIASYLAAVAGEAGRRGYRFEVSRIDRAPALLSLDATVGQLAFEWTHLIAKLTVRSPAALPDPSESGVIQAHPIFRIVEGPPADWERQ